jgi:uncharacterized protein (TIGR02246 family)
MAEHGCPHDLWTALPAALKRGVSVHFLKDGQTGLDTVMGAEHLKAEEDAQVHGPALAEIQDRWNAAASTWDIKALSQLYSEDALFFGLRPKFYVGRDAIEEYFSSYRDVLKSVRLKFFEERTRSIGKGIFAAQGFGDILNQRQDGTTIANTVRFSFVIVETEGSWQILLHHFSDVLGESRSG